jgi:hypothetical protein
VPWRKIKQLFVMRNVSKAQIQSVTKSEHLLVLKRIAHMVTLCFKTSPSQHAMNKNSSVSTTSQFALIYSATIIFTLFWLSVSWDVRFVSTEPTALHDSFPIPIPCKLELWDIAMNFIAMRSTEWKSPSLLKADLCLQTLDTILQPLL